MVAVFHLKTYNSATLHNEQNCCAKLLKSRSTWQECKCRHIEPMWAGHISLQKGICACSATKSLPNSDIEHATVARCPCRARLVRCLECACCSSVECRQLPTMVVSAHVMPQMLLGQLFAT